MTSPASCDDLLFSCLSEADLASFSRTCLQVYLSVQSYRARAFQLWRSLSRFMPQCDVDGFREMLHETGALVSGSVALQFFSRECIPDCDLDLYTEREYAPRVFSYVCDLGYRFRPRASQMPDAKRSLCRVLDVLEGRDLDAFRQRSVLDVFDFERVGHESVVIQVVVAADCSVDAMLGSHSSACRSCTSQLSLTWAHLSSGHEHNHL